MINTNEDKNAVVTRGILDEAMAKMEAKIDAAVGSLAIMVEKGFAGMAKDFAKLTARVDKVEARLDKIEARLDKIELRLTAVEKNVDARFEAVFLELKDIRKEISIDQHKTRADVAGLEFRVDKLEKKVGL
jgi:uncharacterized protein YaaN involved in tellurite resistance